jgi:hypothetical protein
MMKKMMIMTFLSVLLMSSPLRLVAATAAADEAQTITTALLLTLISEPSVSSSSHSSFSSSSPHYEKPPCTNGDERAVQIMGINGEFCSPSCTDKPCPLDVPDGVTATPSCALQSPTGQDKFCAILCRPSSDTTDRSMTTFMMMKRGSAIKNGGGECGPMTCQPIPQAQGLGICVYVEEHDVMNMEVAK